MKKGTLETVIVDTRERERGKAALDYYEQNGLTCRLATLEYGDYLFNDGIVFEYKTMEDFMNSIFDKSVFNETYNQMMPYPYSFLIIVGDLEDYYIELLKLGMSPRRETLVKRFRGAVRRVRTYSNVIMCKNMVEAFNEMLEQAKKCADGKSMYYGNVVREVPGQDVVDYILGRTYGIGASRIPVIREALGIRTVDDLLACSVEDFASIKGIGVKTAQRLYDFIHSRNIEKKRMV